jgi:F-type H+-transporting ATPase subunit delta
MKASITNELAQVLLELKEPAEIKRFAEYLKKKGLLGKAPAIMAEYQRLYNEKHEIVDALVTLAARLPDKDKKELAEVLKKKHGAKEVTIEERVDMRLIGGMKVKIGDTVYDGSVQNSLKQLQAQLLK